MPGRVKASLLANLEVTWADEVLRGEVALPNRLSSDAVRLLTLLATGGDEQAAQRAFAERALDEMRRQQR